MILRKQILVNVLHNDSSVILVLTASAATSGVRFGGSGGNILGYPEAEPEPEPEFFNSSLSRSLGLPLLAVEGGLERFCECEFEDVDEEEEDERGRLGLGEDIDSVDVGEGVGAKCLMVVLARWR